MLVLLLEHRDEIVTRDQIVSRIWGQGVFLDTDNTIRGAIRKLRQVLKDDAETPRFIQLLGSDYVQAGMHSEAINELNQATRLSGDNPLYRAQLAVALATAGRSDEALQIADELQVNGKQRYVSPYGLAQTYAALKMDAETFQWLQTAGRDRAVWMGYLAVDPTFDPYRSDHRFQEILQRTGLR